MANKLTKLRVCYPLIKASADINSNTINVIIFSGNNDVLPSNNNQCRLMEGQFNERSRAII